MAHQKTQTSLADLLEDYLEDLDEEQIKKFKSKLSHTKYKELDTLSWGWVKGLDKTDLANKMISYYGEADALNVMLIILKKINLNDLAERLILQKCNLARSELGHVSEKRELMRDRIKCNLKKKFECIFEGKAKEGQLTLLKDIYTELYITEGGTGGINDEHEVRQIETSSKKWRTEDIPVKCNDVFKPLCGRETPIRTVLTKGVAGIGKTVSVQKFILDWADGKANQDIDFIFALPFRDLNLIKGEYSLNELLHYFVPELKPFEFTELLSYKVLFIFDGLDECRFSLDFQNDESCCDVTKKSLLDVLLTHLIKGNLLPSALLWITSRPAATNQIPTKWIDQVTEIQGFSDAQKEEYFRKRFSDQSLASRIITHVKSSRSLFIMCHIPVFCCISATVLESLFSKTESGEIPRTLTEMYTHFMIFQKRLIKNKYLPQTSAAPNETRWHRKLKNGLMKNNETYIRHLLLKLGKLAFDNLEKRYHIFYKKDLEQSDLDIREVSVYSGVCTEVFKEEHGLYQDKVYCFVHLSIQEYLAALYVFTSKSSANLLKTAVDQALESKNGHLDLYLRFLLGLSTDFSKTLLERLLGKRRFSSHNVEKTAQYIKTKIKENLSTERTINLFHCLNELGDKSLVEEVQRHLNSERSAEDLSTTQYSALAFVLLMSDKELDVFDLKKYMKSWSQGDHWKLLPVVKISKTALLNSCYLTETCCDSLASALRSNSPPLRELDLSDNDLHDSGVKLLSAGLGDSHCKLEILRLNRCILTETCCDGLASALRSNSSRLRELDLSNNDLQDSGVKLLSAGLRVSHCKLEILRLNSCNLTETCCDALASALRSNSSPLRELDLSNNDLQDSGVTLLSAGLGDSHCKLEILRLSGCRVTEGGCSSLASALRSNPSHLRQLDLSYNHPGDSGVKLLSAVLEDPRCKLEKPNVDHCGECMTRPGLQKYSCQLTLDPNTAHRCLSLSEGNRKVTEGAEQPYPNHPERFDRWKQVLCRESLTGRCYWEAEWSGDRAMIGVTYKGIRRKEGWDCGIGANDKSWSLCCNPVRYFVCHNNKRTDIPIRPSSPGRVGVYLDWGAGTLSFYRVSSDGLTPLYRFTSSFTEPLYPGFYVHPNCTVSL